MTDQTLVSHVLQGDMQAFKRLIKQHERLVGFMVGKLVKNKEEHEEICQDVFIKVYDKLKDFNFESKLSTWVATIAYRHAINSVRKGKREMISIPEDDLSAKHFIQVESPESILIDADLDKFVLQLIDRLPGQYKILLTLYHVEGMSYQEIATITGMPEGTIKSYLFRARSLLKEVVEKYIPKEDLYESRQRTTK
jgi:RNA polymerase sigma factor (sigma-70 family)